MTDFEALFGADLRLLGNLLHAEQRERGSDLFVAIRPASSRTDLQRVTGVENLQQALLVRFLTQVGELEPLGHPSYGSRLHELVGQLNTETTRNRAKLYRAAGVGGRAADRAGPLDRGGDRPETADADRNQGRRSSPSTTRPR